MAGSGIVFKQLGGDHETSNDILFLRPEHLFEIGVARFRGKTDLYHAVCIEVMEARVVVFAMPSSGSPSPEVGTSGVAKMNAQTHFRYVFVSRVLECYEDLVMAEFNAHQFYLVIRRVYQGYLTGR